MCVPALQYKAEIVKLEHKRNTTSMSLQDEKALIKQIEKVRRNHFVRVIHPIQSDVLGHLLRFARIFAYRS